MKCKMFLWALSAMALSTGCSNDETTELNKGNAINFSVTAGKLTRAAATTTDNINQFKVWAQIGDGELNGKSYMDGVEVKKNGSKWEYTGTKFWPEVSLNFFAYSPINPQHLVHVPNKHFVFDYEVAANGDEDFLYATNRNETKEAHKTAPVLINFRHALSQIVFNAKLTENSSINVDIKGIKIEGIANKATFTHPTEKATAPNLPDGDADTETDGSWATWTDIAGEASYKVYDAAAISLDNTAKAIGENLFLMPQTLKPWLTADGKISKTGKARLLINCKITDKKTGLQLWPKTGDEYADVAVSLDNPKNDPHRGTTTETQSKHDKWMQGKKYTYTLIFGEGGGYNPDPTDPDNPDPVLVPITFKVTVDEFQDGGNFDLNANYPNP